jgi:thiol:disulfide interchange protein DsbD
LKEDVVGRGLTLVQMNMTESDIAQVKKIVKNNKDINWTYYEVLQELSENRPLSNTMDCLMPSYLDSFALPFNLDGYFELSEGIECSKISNKPVLLYFSRHSSVEARKFEYNVIADSEIQKLLHQKFIITKLYVDEESNALPKYHIFSEESNDTIKQKGKINQHYQKELFNEEIQPVFYILDSSSNQIIEPYYYDLSIDSYKKFLEKGLERYYKQ